MSLVPAAPSYPRTPYIAGPNRRMAILPCVCGRWVRADRFAPAVGVANHQRTREHRLWRAEHGL